MVEVQSIVENLNQEDFFSKNTQNIPFPSINFDAKRVILKAEKAWE